MVEVVERAICLGSLRILSYSPNVEHYLPEFSELVPWALVLGVWVDADVYWSLRLPHPLPEQVPKNFCPPLAA